MKKISVARQNIHGRLDLAILKELEEQGVIETKTAVVIDNEYEIKFGRKNNRKNGKQIAILTPFLKAEVLKCWWLKDVYRFNTWQECTLVEMTEEEKRQVLKTTRFDW